jgi:hypothetical protein
MGQQAALPTERDPRFVEAYVPVWQVRREMWKVGKTGSSFGNFVFLGLLSNSRIMQ